MANYFRVLFFTSFIAEKTITLIKISLLPFVYYLEIVEKLVA